MNGASSLLSKYTSLTDSIHRCRTESKSYEAQISSLQSDIVALETTQQSMQHDLQSAICETSELSKSMLTGTGIGSSSGIAGSAKGAGHYCQNLVREEMESRQKADITKQQLSQNQEYRKIASREFRKSCREFRMAVRRARVSLEGFEDDRVGARDTYCATGSDDGASFEHNRGIEDECDNGDDDDDNANDAEMKQALHQKDTSTQLLKTAQESLERTNRIKNKLEKEARGRIENLQQQRNQLDRVRKDVQDMERELAELEQGTKECEQISEGYAKDATRRRQNQRRGNAINATNTPRSTTSRDRHGVTPSPHNSNYHYNTMNNSVSSTSKRPIFNPYKKQTQANQFVYNPYKRGKNNASDNTRTLSRNSTANESGASVSSSSLQRLQHPHRAGRIRVDRQFKASVSIDVCDSSDIDDDRGSHIYNNVEDANANTETNNNTNANRKNEGNLGHELDRSNDADEHNTSYSSNTSSESSDEDDDVLLFMPFTQGE